MKQRLLALIGVILYIGNVDASQYKKQAFDEKLPKMPNSLLPEKLKNAVTTGHARLTTDLSKGKCDKAQRISTPLPKIVEKYFSRNVEPLQFDKFSFSDIDSVVNQQNTEYSYSHYLSQVCKMEDVINNGAECSIPYGYTRTSAEFMINNSNVTTVKMVSSMRHISEKSFYNCINLSNIEIFGTPKLLYIGDKSFMNTGLKKVVIPYGVKYIGIDAFSSCRFLEEIHIPASVSDIGFNIANDCPNLNDIFLPHHTVIRLNKIPNCRLYVLNLRFTDISEGFFSPVGSFRNLNIHRKNRDGSYTNIAIYNNFIVYNHGESCRNACVQLDCVTKNDGVIF